MNDVKYAINFKLLTVFLFCSVATYSLEHYADLGIIPTKLGWISVLVLPVICLLLIQRFIFKNLAEYLFKRKMTPKMIEEMKKARIKEEDITTALTVDKILNDD